MTRTLLLLALLCACTARPDKPQASTARQREQCLAISHSGDDLTRCLVVQYDWDAAPALAEGQVLQARIDSLLRIDQARIDSLTRIYRERATAQEAARFLAEWESDAWQTLGRDGYDTILRRAFLKRVRRAVGRSPDSDALAVATRDRNVIANMIELRYDTLSRCRDAVDSIYNVVQGSARERSAVTAIVCSSRP